MVEVPDNPFTRLIDEVAARNRAGGGGLASATPLPGVRSADFGRVAPVSEVPMTLEEREQLDHLAREAGVLDERLGNTDPATQPSQYATMEEALQAAAPVEPEHPRMTARQFIGANATSGQFTVTGNFTPSFTAPMRMPDFKNVSSIDLVRGMIGIDGVEFPIPTDELLHLRLLAVEIVRDVITAKLREALEFISAPPAAEASKDGDTPAAATDVQRESAGDRQESAE